MSSCLMAGEGSEEVKRYFQISVIPFLLALAASPALAAHVHPESHYQTAWCAEHHGQVEFRLPDGARVDCLTESNAIEFDFAPKWAEGLGQALYYGSQTGRRPGVVLIMEKPGDERYRERLDGAIRAYGLPVEVWEMGVR
jgi:hypothetical protein